MENTIHELTAGYALDALDPGERDAYELHLASCESCQGDLASFWEVSGALAVAATGPEPSPALRDRILAAARAEKQVVVPLESRRRRASPVLASVTAIAAAVAIGLGIWSISLHGDLNDTRAALTQEQEATAVLADPAAQTVALQTGSGRLVVDPDGKSVLVLDGLGAAPTGKTYQAWVVTGQKPISAGIFGSSGAQTVVPIAGTVPTGSVVAVTVEQAGGADSPTLPPLASSKPV